MVLLSILWKTAALVYVVWQHGIAQTQFRNKILNPQEKFFFHKMENYTGFALVSIITTVIKCRIIKS